MSASNLSRVLVLLAALAGTALTHAQGKVNIEDLKLRSAAGERAATRQLAEMYYLGRGGVEQDFAEAARWYEKLARQGDRRAQTSLGLMYARGYGVEKDLGQALKWWSLAAAQNDPGAQFNLGVLYSAGEGVEPDYPRAAQWLDRAAQRGHVQAQRNLGVLYHEGKGVPRDPVRAYFWLKVASLQGDEPSGETLRIIARGMAEDDVKQAEAEAAKWMERYRKMLK